MKKKIYIISTMISLSMLCAILMMISILALMRFEILDKSFLYNVFIMNNGILYTSTAVGALLGSKLGRFWWKSIYIDKKHRSFRK